MVAALSGSIYMGEVERLSVAITRVETQLRRADIKGVTIELEMLEQENERFMRTLVHAFNAEDFQAGAEESKTPVSVSMPD